MFRLCFKALKNNEKNTFLKLFVLVLGTLRHLPVSSEMDEGRLLLESLDTLCYGQEQFHTKALRNNTYEEFIY